MPAPGVCVPEPVLLADLDDAPDLHNGRQMRKGSVEKNG